MLIAPAATAYLISKSIKQTFIWSMTFGVSAAVIGYYSAKWFDTSIAGMMATAVGVIFILVFTFNKISQLLSKKAVET